MPTLDPHQVEAAAYLIANPRNMLADAPGVGKTAPGVVAASVSGNKLLVGCRAVARTNWLREVNMWWPELPAENLMIVSHDGLAVNPETVWKAKQFGADVLLADEMHHCSSQAAKRTMAYYGPRCDGRAGIVERIDCVWPLTGTPMPANASQMWTHLRALRPDLITLPGSAAPLDFTQFINRYLNYSMGDYGPRFWGNKKDTLDELRHIFKSFMLRRTEGTIKLPPLNFEAVIVDCPVAKDVLREMSELQSEKSVKLLMESMSAAESSGQEFTWSASEAATGELRRIMGEVKAPVIGRLIAEELDDNAYNKVVVFAYHHSVIEILYEQLIEFHPVVLTGETSQVKRQQAIDSFQTDSHVRVFIGQMQACSESITLTAAHQVVFAEDDWKPDTITQAAARCRRRGQKEVVYARVYGLANSLDEGVARVRVRKAKMTAEVQ